MSRQYCFLCASDEGVFLDITSDNKQTFYDQLETCTLGKVNTANDSLTKICHKCAYELNQCSSFVRKYKQSCDKLKQKVKVLKYCCSLCLEPGKKGYIFDLQKDRNSASDFFTKINQLFNYNVDKREAKSKLICLTCRYCVDVLYDLKSTFQQTTAKLKDGVNEQIDIVNCPKTKTSVVSRKTTTTEPARIAAEISSDSDNCSPIMKHKQSRITKLKKTKSVAKPTTRVCDKCQNDVKKGEDMYRFYITGHTVCKNCWRTADPSKQNAKPRIRRNYAETKLCTILLKDVSKDSSSAEWKLDKSEAKKDENIEEPLIVIDSSSENELPQPKLRRKLRRPVVTNVENDVVKPVQKRTTRRSVPADSGSEDKANKKFKSEKEKTEVEASKVDEPVAAQKEAVPETQQNSNKSNASQSNDSVSDSSLPNDVSKSKDSTIANDVSKSKDSTIANDVSKSKDSTIANDVSKSKDSKAHDGVREKRKRGNKASLSDADVVLKGNRKKLKTIFEGITTSKTVYLSDGTLSNDDSTSKRKKTRFASVSPVMDDVSGDDKTTRNIKSKAGPASSKMAHSRRKIKSASDTTSPTVPTVESDDKEPADANDETSYVCDECGNRYENKLDNLTHKLTHSKQPQLKLEKVVLQDVGKTASDVSPAADETEEQCDAIEISVDDDEEESTTGDMNNSHGNDKVITDSNNVVDQECSSEKEAVEDAIDTKLVIEESDEQGEDNEKSNLDTASTKESVEKEDTDSAVKTSEKVTDHDSNEKSKKKDGGNNETSKETDKHVEVDDNRKENEDTSDTTEKEKEPTNQKETENTKTRLEEEDEDEAEIDVVEDDKEKTQRDSKERKKDKEAAEEDKDDAKKDTEEAEEDAEEAKKDAEEAKKDAEEAEVDKEEAEGDKEEAEVDKEEVEVDKEEAEVDKEDAQEETEKDEEVAKEKEETEDKDAEDEAEEDKEVAEDKEETGDKDEKDEKSDSQTQEEKCCKDFNLVVEEDEPEVIRKNGSQVVEEKDDESETDIRIVDTGSFDDCVEQNLPESTKDSEDDEVNVINDDDDSGDLEITDENVKCKRSAGKGENTSQNTITLSSEDEDEDDEVEVTESTVPKSQKRRTDSKKRTSEVLGEDDEVKATESKVPKSQKKKTDSKKRKTEVLEEDDEVNVTESNVPKSQKKKSDSKKGKTEVLEEDDEVNVTESNVPKLQKKKSDSKKGTSEVLQEVFDLASAEVQKRQVTVADETNSTVVEPETLENISREVNSLMVKN